MSELALSAAEAEDYRLRPDAKVQEGVPQGKIIEGEFKQSKVFPGPALHRELATLVEAGMTPAEAIRAATLDPARWLERSDDPSFGVVGVGKRADLLLVVGSENSSNTQALVRVGRNAGVPAHRCGVHRMLSG